MLISWWWVRLFGFHYQSKFHHGSSLSADHFLLCSLREVCQRLLSLVKAFSLNPFPGDVFSRCSQKFIARKGPFTVLIIRRDLSVSLPGEHSLSNSIRHLADERLVPTWINLCCQWSEGHRWTCRCPFPGNKDSVLTFPSNQWASAGTRWQSSDVWPQNSWTVFTYYSYSFSFISCYCFS